MVKHACLRAYISQPPKPSADFDELRRTVLGAGATDSARWAHQFRDPHRAEDRDALRIVATIHRYREVRRSDCVVCLLSGGDADQGQLALVQFAVGLGKPAFLVSKERVPAVHANHPLVHVVRQGPEARAQLTRLLGRLRRPTQAPLSPTKLHLGVGRWRAPTALSKPFKCPGPIKLRLK